MRKDSCAQCKFFRIAGSTPLHFQGRCVRYAPNPEFAHVSPGEWCGDFERGAFDAMVANSPHYSRIRLKSLYDGLERRELRPGDEGKPCCINGEPAVFLGFGKHGWVIGEGEDGKVLHRPAHDGSIEVEPEV